jgi:anti-sigma regulatory factor (Ser/Thr protein kinase)
MIGEGSMMFVPIAADDLVFGVLAVGCAPNGHVYSEDNLTICRSLAERAGTAIAHARRFRREERLAMSLQNASLPRALPRIPRLSLTALYAPGKDEARIGGDWYDVFSLDQGRTLISIGDVGGSGIEAATVMSAARQWVRAAARIDWDPGSILAVVDRTLSSDYPDIYATAFIGVIDHGHGTLAYCSAGHPVPLLRHADGSVEQLGDAGLPLGIRGAGEPGTSTRTLAAGDLLLLYTDGLIEANRDIIEGERRLRRAASSASIAAGSEPARALHELIVPDGASDDLTILAIKLDDASSAVPTAEPRSLSFASEIAAQHASWRCYSSDEASARSIRRELARFLEHHGASDEDLFNAEAVCGELLANVHEHACGPLDVELSWSGSSPVLHVMDRGPGFHWTAGPRQDAWQQQGRGLYLVSKLTQNFSVEARDGGRGAHCRAVLGFRRSEHLPAFAELSATDSILNRV